MNKLLYLTGDLNTVGAQIPNQFGIRMVVHIRFMARPFENQTMASLGHFIYIFFFFLM